MYKISKFWEMLPLLGKKGYRDAPLYLFHLQPIPRKFALKHQKSLIIGYLFFRDIWTNQKILRKCGNFSPIQGDFFRKFWWNVSRKESQSTLVHHSNLRGAPLARVAHPGIFGDQQMNISCQWISLTVNQKNQKSEIIYSNLLAVNEYYLLSSIRLDCQDFYLMVNS